MKEAGGRRSKKVAERADRVVRTFLFTDMVMSTDIQSQLHDTQGEVEGERIFKEKILDPHDRQIGQCVGSDGEIVSVPGDSFVVAFLDARKAVECAVAIQRSFIAHPVPIPGAGDRLPERVQVRIGLHTGPVKRVVRGGKRNYQGRALSIAKRIQEYAEGERILVSEETWDQAGTITGIRKHECRGYRLKGVGGVWTLVDVLWDDRNPRCPKHRGSKPDRRLLERYLQTVWEGSAKLKLTTIDLKAVTGSPSAAELDLGAVFTDLDVREAPDVATGMVRSRGSLDRIAPEPVRDRLPAMAALSRHPKLVLLGDPGSGKSTLVNFVALCLAAEGLRKRETNARSLGKAWKLPRLLPLRVILRDYAARGLADGKGLWGFLQDELATVTDAQGDLSACVEAIEEALKRPRGALLLLDGLDEVPEAGQRRVGLKKAVESFARQFTHCRIVVTSRPYGYQDPEAWLDDFAVRTLMDFTPDQIKTFIGRWYAHVGAKDPALGRANAERYARQLTHVVETYSRIADLARRPLLLTLMASLHRWREGGNLPDKRQELYEQSVELLIHLWQRPKTGFDQQGRPIGSQQYDVFQELGIQQKRLRDALSLVAFEAHRDQPVPEGTHDISVRQLAGALYEASDDKQRANEERVIRYVTDRTGILIEREQRQIYTFPHRAFQEYLAACHLANGDPREMARLLRLSDERWREVALLAAARIFGTTEWHFWSLLEAFCPHDWPPGEGVTDADWYGALRATEALVEAEQETRAPQDRQLLVRRLSAWLVQLLTRGALPPRERARAGLLLNRLPGGDPRIEKDEWVEIPGGEFTMGTSDEEIARLIQKYDWARHWQKERWFERERPAKVRLPAHRIGKYPVTNGQYRRFVDAGGYRPEGKHYWSSEGWKWREKEKRTEPGYWDDTRFNAGNLPLVGVSWYEAEAYCSWLTEHLQRTGDIGRDQVVRLPHEDEWEYAARGPDRHTWPWGNDWDPDRANTWEGQVGGPTPVGMYPDGRSAFEVLDMAGNVWEWCEDWYEKGRFKSLRGGSWLLPADPARSAFRGRDTPVLADDGVGFRCVVAPPGSPPK